MWPPPHGTDASVDSMRFLNFLLLGSTEYYRIEGNRSGAVRLSSAGSEQASNMRGVARWAVSLYLKRLFRR